jgi:hypothetical protein
VPSVPRTSDSGSGFLPTPTDVSKGGGSSRSGDRISETPTLQGMARKGIWPTPTAGMADRGDRGDLNTAVKGYPSPSGHTKMWPTHVESDSRASGRQTTTTGKSHPGTGLTDATRMWPTPDASMGSGGRVSKNPPTGTRPSGAKQAITLNDAVKWWPTPKGSPSGPDFARMHRPESGGDDLATAVARQMWPTPQAHDATHPGHAARDKGRPHAPANLPDRVMSQMYPTPSASMSDAWTMESQRLSGQERKRMKEVGTPFQTASGGQLNPRWVSVLMGYPPDWTEVE